MPNNIIDLDSDISRPLIVVDDYSRFVYDSNEEIDNAIDDIVMDNGSRIAINLTNQEENRMLKKIQKKQQKKQNQKENIVKKIQEKRNSVNSVINNIEI